MFSLYPSIHISFYQISFWLSVKSIYPSIFYLLKSLCIFDISNLDLYIYRSIYLSTYLPNYLSIYPSIHLSIHPSIHLSIYLFIYLASILGFSSHMRKEHKDCDLEKNKPFSCNLCTQSFYFKSSLNSHRSKAHHEVIIKKNVCNMKTTFKISFFIKKISRRGRGLYNEYIVNLRATHEIHSLYCKKRLPRTSPPDRTIYNPCCYVIKTDS